MRPSKSFHLYSELLELVYQRDATFGEDLPSTYAAACRWTPRGQKRFLETWSHILRLGEPLPALSIWLAENYFVPLDLEASYVETCQVFRIA